MIGNEEQVKVAMDILKREIKVWNEWKLLSLAMELVDAINKKRKPEK